MASSLTLTSLLDKYPSGTTIGAYKQSNWATYQFPPSGAPVGSSDATGSVSASGAVTLTGLTDDTDFFLVQPSGGTYVYTRASTRITHAQIPDASVTTPDLSAATRHLLENNVYNVMDPAYGAVNDGTSQAATAFQAAYDAAVVTGGSVYIPDGTFLVSDLGTTSIFKIRANTPVTTPSVRVFGPGVLKGSTNTPKLADFDRTADDQTFRNVNFDGVNFDRNNVGAANGDAIFGNRNGDSYNNGQRSNYSNIRVQNCHFWNLPRGSSTHANCHVSIASRQTAGGQAVNTLDNIYVENNTLEGGDVGIGVVGNGPDATVVITFDRVFIRRNKWDSGSVTDGTAKTAAGCQIGGYAAGGYCEVSGNEFANSWDVGIEVDNATTLLSYGNKVTDSATANYLYLNFVTPTNGVAAQRYICWGDESRIINYNPPATDINAGNGYGWFLSRSGSPTLGSVSLIDLSHYSKATNFRVSGEAICCPDLPLSHLAVYNPNFVHEGISDSTSSTPKSQFVRAASSVASHMEWYGGRVWVDGTFSGTATTFRLIQFGGAGSTELTIQPPVFKNTLTCTGSTLYLIWFGKGPSSTNGTFGHIIVRGGSIESWTGTNGNGIGIEGGPGALTVDRIDIDGFNFKNMPGGTDIVFGAASQAMRTYLQNIRYRVHPPAPTTNNTKFASTTFTSATGNQFIGGYRARVSVTGGTAVTALDTSVDNSTYVNKLTQASGAIASPVNFILETGEYLKITSTGTMPTVSVEPLV